jgi:hypothetical protein
MVKFLKLTFLKAGEVTMNARINLLIAATAFQAFALTSAGAATGTATVLTDPVPLPPGATVSPIPNGYSFDSDDSTTALFSITQNFDFEDGPSGFLFEAVYSFPDQSPAHPYGSGLFFIYNLVLTAGDATSLSVPGYSGHEVSVKQCGIVNCIDYGSFGALMTSASRTSAGNGDRVTFNFDVTGPGNSSNLQLFTNASSYVDPNGILTDSAGGTFSIPVITPGAVPEPSTWAMTVIGFAGLGWLARQGRRKVTPG